MQLTLSKNSNRPLIIVNVDLNVAKFKEGRHTSENYGADKSKSELCKETYTIHTLQPVG